MIGAQSFAIQGSAGLRAQDFGVGVCSGAVPDQVKSRSHLQEGRPTGVRVKLARASGPLLGSSQGLVIRTSRTYRKTIKQNV